MKRPMRLSRKWKMLAGSLTLLVVTNCATLPEPVVTIAEPLCDQIQPIEYSMRDKDGDFESRENIYDTDETAIKIFRLNTKILAACGT